MKHILQLTILPVLLLMNLNLHAQVFPVDTLSYNGSPTEILNLVIVGDGYTAAEMSKFRTDATAVKDYFFSQSPFTEYANYFNVFAIEVPSNESGASHEGTAGDWGCSDVPIDTVDNYFGSNFDNGSIHRLVCISDYAAASSVLNDNCPEYDIALFLVNTPYYGGSGGWFAVSTTHSSSGDVSVHEIGHSFGDLADEYWAGYKYEACNATQDNNPSTIIWKNWLYDNGVGIYQYSEDTTWYRPHQNCKMRLLNVPFCSVCSENIIENIHSLVNPILAYLPDNSTTINTFDSITFTLDLLKPNPSTLSTQWLLNSTIIASDCDSITLPFDSLQAGYNTLSVYVIDSTPLTRRDNHWTDHLYIIDWDILKSFTGIQSIANLSETTFTVYPNPLCDHATVSYSLGKTTNVCIDIVSADGKIIKTLLNKTQSEGTYKLSINRRDAGNKAGMVYIRLSINGYNLVRPIIIKK